MMKTEETKTESTEAAEETPATVEETKPEAGLITDEQSAATLAYDVELEERRRTLSVLARTTGEDQRALDGEAQGLVSRTDEEGNPVEMLETCDAVLVAHQDGTFSKELFAKDGVPALQPGSVSK